MRLLLIEARREEADEKLILAAFVGWQLGAAGKKTFGEYLEALGLSDKAPQDGSQKEQTQAQRIEQQKSQDTKLTHMDIEVKKVKGKDKP